MTNRPTYFYWWCLAIAANFLWLLFSCLCWFTKNVGLCLSLPEQRRYLPTSEMVKRCTLVQISIRNGNFHQTDFAKWRIFKITKGMMQNEALQCNPSSENLGFPFFNKKQLIFVLIHHGIQLNLLIWALPCGSFNSQLSSLYYGSIVLWRTVGPKK